MHKVCLVLAHVFPPVNAVGVHRTVALCRHLVEQGWSVTVITARPEEGANRDPRLAMRVPQEVRIVRTPAPHLLRLLGRVLGRRHTSGRPHTSEAGALLAGHEPVRERRIRQIVEWLSLWLCVPDGYIGWFVPALWAGMREARRQRPHVIYSTAPQWVGHLVAAALSRLLRVPWVADFRDPWHGNPWRLVMTEGSPAHRRADAALERWAVHRAARVTCAVDGIRQLLAARYPQKAACIETVHNGFDPDLVDQIVPRRLGGDGCVLLHAGTLYGPRSPVPLLDGLKRLRAESPAEAALFRIVFVGLPTYNGRPLADFARERGIADLVEVILPVSYHEALAHIKGADVAVLFGQTGEGAIAPIPAKVYEYIRMGKAVLAIEAGEEALEVLRGGGCRAWQANGSDGGAFAVVLRDVLAAHRRGELSPGAPNPARLAFTRRHMAERLASVLEESITGPRRPVAGRMPVAGAAACAGAPGQTLARDGQARAGERSAVRSGGDA